MYSYPLDIEYQTIFENTGTAMIIVEKDRTISLANKGFEDLSGYSREDVEDKKTWDEFFAPEDTEKMMKYHELRREDPQLAPSVYKARFVNREGEERQVIMNVDLIPDSSKSVASILDITIQEQKKRALRQSRKEYTELFNHMTDAGFIHGLDGNILEANSAAVNRLGYSREKLLEMNLSDIVPPQNREELKKEIERLTEEEDLIFESVHVTKSGKKIPVEIASGLINYRARPAVLSVVRDVSERKKWEKKLQAVGEVSRKLKLADDRDELYELVMNSTQDILGYNNCAILELQGKNLVIVKSRGYYPQTKRVPYSLDGKGVTVAAIKKEEPIYVPDVNEDSRYIEGAPGARCEYAIPITYGEVKYGILNVENDVPDSIPLSDQNLFQALASEMAVALKGLERLRLINDSREKLRGLHFAVDELQKCDSEEKVCKVAANAAKSILEFDMCGISLLEGDLLVPKAVSEGISSEDIATFRVGEGITGKTVEKGESILLDDIRGSEIARPARDDLRAVISVPIGDFGNLQIVSKTVGAFDDEDLKLTEILAGHLREEIKRVRLETELREQAIRDPLTGVYNRRYFNTMLAKEAERCKRYNHKLAFLMADIDDFKIVNDRYSHLRGDEVLRQVAQVFRGVVREADTVVRYGGDEFLILLPETGGEVRRVRNRISEELAEWNKRNGLIDFPLKVAIGTAYWDPQGNQSVDAVLKQADRMMYRQKGKRKE